MYDRIKQEIERTRALLDLLKTTGRSDTLNKEDVVRHADLLYKRISFYQHERLIHLLVLILIALLTFGAVIVTMITRNIYVGISAVLFFALLIPYIVHYYHLENGVQKLYSLFDDLVTFLEDKNG